MISNLLMISNLSPPRGDSIAVAHPGRIFRSDFFHTSSPGRAGPPVRETVAR
jgi:hypothetical protein